MKLNEVEPVSGMLAAANNLLKTGGATTVIVAVLLGLPAPVSVALIAPVVLFITPGVVPVTVTVTKQVVPGARLAPDKAMLVGTVVVSVPPQTVLVALATVRPAGKVSVKATPVSVKLALVLWSVNVRVAVLFSAIVVALNAFEIVGGLTTVMLAVATLPVRPPASVAVTFELVLF